MEDKVIAISLMVCVLTFSFPSAHIFEIVIKFGAKLHTQTIFSTTLTFTNMQIKSKKELTST